MAACLKGLPPIGKGRESKAEEVLQGHWKILAQCGKFIKTINTWEKRGKASYAGGGGESETAEG